MKCIWVGNVTKAPSDRSPPAPNDIHAMPRFKVLRVSRLKELGPTQGLIKKSWIYTQ